MNIEASHSRIGLKPRQRRSIGYLASRVLTQLPNEPLPNEKWEMTIEQVMAKFGASRGSVYELFHVFEALLLVTKISKNTFRWWGVQNLTQTLVFLRFTALHLGFDTEILHTKQAVRKILGSDEFFPNSFSGRLPQKRFSVVPFKTKVHHLPKLLGESTS